MIQRLGHVPDEVLLRADSVCIAGRRMFENAIRAEQAEKEYPPELAQSKASAQGRTHRANG